MKHLVMGLLALLSCVSGSAALAAEAVKTLLATTFPVSQLVQVVAAGRKGVAVERMIPAELGCPHDYVLSPQDLQKIAKADVLVINGLGLEEFLGAAVRNANPKLRTIDSSKGIDGILRDAHGPNPHLFASPRMVGRMALSIAGQLADLDPDGKAVYMANAKAYAAKMNGLADEFVKLGKTLKNNRVVTQHGVLDYLAADAGIKVVATLHDHPGQEPSAAELVSLIRRLKAARPGAILTEPQYPAKTAETLSRETGIPTATFDPSATGPDEASAEHYEQTMRKNLETIEKLLGKK